MESSIGKYQITVLMSTYNGEEYLQEQIESILKQEGVEVRLIVRDDGSCDKTLSILEHYSRKGLLSFHAENNVGPQQSFLQLLQEAPTDDYYAFADQDDIWFPDKLINGIRGICDNPQIPSLYFSQTLLTDERLNPIPTEPIHPKLTFGESLVYAYASGCTMVLNHELRKKILSYTPSYIDMHDRWLINIVTAIGGILIFDKEPHILYRQHARNAIGLHDSLYKEWKQRLRRIFHNQQIRYRIATEIYHGYLHLMPQEHVETLELFIHAKHRIRPRLQLLFDSRFHCGNRKTWLMFKLSVLINTY